MAAPRRKTTVDPDNGLRVIYRPLDALRPYNRNARTHSTTQVAQIVASIREFGFTNPLLIDETGEIIAGHGRLAAASQIGLATVPTITLTGLTPSQRKALRIADNKLALNADWDESLLASELADLKLENFDIELTGFDEYELTDIFAEDNDEPKSNRDLTPEESELMDAAWRILMNDWKQITTEGLSRNYISTSLTKGALAVRYLRSLFFDEEVPRSSTMAYTGHRFFVSGEKYPISDVFGAAIQNVSILHGMQFALDGMPSFDKLMSGSLPVHGHRAPLDFPASLAKSLIDELCPCAGGRVLDPCHGWGGRAIGFLLSNRSSHYHGFDVDPDTQSGVRMMLADLTALTPSRDKTFKLDLVPFEQADIPQSSYDFAMTSPPYYDVEKYEGDQSSWKMYPDFDAWVAGFYRPMIASVARSLRPNCSFALQVGSQIYPLRETAVDISRDVGLHHVETRSTNMINNQAKTDENDGEVVVILQKNGG